ncbi:Sensory box/GGDEF family protein [Lachnospiraceae bacterium TWA4]|nr:Sensory box/GGDEF family protein [Lachnospiraceae bacterium TWA4]
MNEKFYSDIPIPVENVGVLGVEFESIAQKESPNEAVELLLSVLGKKYQCDRVYVFEKNCQEYYDCTNEWVCHENLSKKHLLQNLSQNAVRQYYSYFARNSKLIIRDMESFSKEDYPLYKMLKAQDLSSVIVGQLVYEGEDKGFIGIDNPSAEFFDELLNLFDFISYFVAVQNYRKDLTKRIIDVNQSMEENINCKVSMYDRVTQLKENKPLGIVYCSIIMQGMLTDYSKNDDNRMILYVEKMFNNIFGQSNVFNLGRNEFLIICEESKESLKEQLLEEIENYLEVASKSLNRLNAHLLDGIVTIDQYENDFFDLVNIANARMQNVKKRYRRIFTEKYHLEDQVFAFSDLVEIRPERNYYKVVYSEYLNKVDLEGNLNDLIAQITHLIVDKDKEKFLEFCQKEVSNYRLNDDLIGEPYFGHFSLYTKSGFVEMVEIVVLHYKDITGESVLMCYSR